MTAKERITQQAAELFLQSGIKAVTMDEISRAAGVSKRTLYELFKDKDALLRECLSHMDKRYEEEVELIVAESDNTIGEIFGRMKLGIYAILTVNPLFFSDMKRYHFKIFNEVLSVNQEKQIEQTHGILKKGINQGLFRKNIHVDIVSILLNEQLKIISDEGVFPQKRFSRVEVFENVVINFFRGIATQKGVALIDEYYEAEPKLFVTG